MNKLLYILFLVLGLVASAQDAPTGLRTWDNEAPPHEFWTKIFRTSGSNTYACYAKQTVKSYTLSPSAVSNAAAAVFTVTGHGFDATQSPTVTISGGTGNWAAVNGKFTLTYIDANTFSIPVNSTTFGGVTGTIVVTATAPRLNQPVWAVSKTVVSSNPDGSLWAMEGFNNKCSDYATLSYQ